MSVVGVIDSESYEFPCEQDSAVTRRCHRNCPDAVTASTDENHITRLRFRFVADHLLIHIFRNTSYGISVKLPIHDIRNPDVGYIAATLCL